MLINIRKEHVNKYNKEHVNNKKERVNKDNLLL